MLNATAVRSRIATDDGVGDADRKEMRGWIQMLRKDAEALRLQAIHMNTVTDDAGSLVMRVEGLLRALNPILGTTLAAYWGIGEAAPLTWRGTRFRNCRLIHRNAF